MQRTWQRPAPDIRVVTRRAVRPLTCLQLMKFRERVRRFNSYVLPMRKPVPAFEQHPEILAPARDHAVMFVRTWFGDYEIKPWKPK